MSRYITQYLSNFQFTSAYIKSTTGSEVSVAAKEIHMCLTHWDEAVRVESDSVCCAEKYTDYRDESHKKEVIAMYSKRLFSAEAHLRRARAMVGFVIDGQISTQGIERYISDFEELYADMTSGWRRVVGGRLIADLQKIIDNMER